MSVLVEGLVLNKLTTSEILELPTKLNQLDIKENEKWYWQDELSEDFLVAYWQRTTNYYRTNLGNQEIYKAPIIWGSGTWSIHFFHKNLISIGIDRNWSPFSKSEELQNEIKSIIRPILTLLKTEDIIFTAELSSRNQDDEINNLTFDNLEETEKFLFRNGFHIIK